MPKTSSFFSFAPLALLFVSTVAHADLIPRGGEGVSECRNKKAGDACENYLIDEVGQHKEPGTCVEEKLDHLSFKFRAHLRCVSASVPFASAAAKKPAPSASVAPSAAPSSAPVPSVPPSAPPPAPSAPVATEAPKSSSCTLAVPSENSVAFGVFLFGLAVLAHARRRR